MSGLERCKRIYSRPLCVRCRIQRLHTDQQSDLTPDWQASRTRQACMASCCTKKNVTAPGSTAPDDQPLVGRQQCSKKSTEPWNPCMIAARTQAHTAREVAWQQLINTIKLKRPSTPSALVLSFSLHTQTEVSKNKRQNVDGCCKGLEIFSAGMPPQSVKALPLKEGRQPKLNREKQAIKPCPRLPPPLEIMPQSNKREHDPYTPPL